jgi:hypothetical protein
MGIGHRYSRCSECSSLDHCFGDGIRYSSIGLWCMGFDHHRSHPPHSSLNGWFGGKHVLNKTWNDRGSQALGSPQRCYSSPETFHRKSMCLLPDHRYWMCKGHDHHSPGMRDSSPRLAPCTDSLFQYRQLLSIASAQASLLRTLRMNYSSLGSEYVRS